MVGLSRARLSLYVAIYVTNLRCLKPSDFTTIVGSHMQSSTLKTLDPELRTDLPSVIELRKHLSGCR